MIRKGRSDSDGDSIVQHHPPDSTISPESADKRKMPGSSLYMASSTLPRGGTRFYEIVCPPSVILQEGSVSTFYGYSYCAH
jgi:hypothetical protein